jgi:hypothetical protein
MFFSVLIGTREYMYRYLRFQGGIRLHCVRSTVTGEYELRPQWNRYKEPTMKKKEKLGLDPRVMRGADPVSVILGKLPAIREWLSCTVYDDGSPRQPGALRIASRNSQWWLTLTDPDRGARLCACDDKLDRALTLLEQLLGVEEAPWEIDPYARQTKGKKGKGG